MSLRKLATVFLGLFVLGSVAFAIYRQVDRAEARRPGSLGGGTGTGETRRPLARDGAGSIFRVVVLSGLGGALFRRTDSSRGQALVDTGDSGCVRGRDGVTCRVVCGDDRDRREPGGREVPGVVPGRGEGEARHGMDLHSGRRLRDTACRIRSVLREVRRR